MISKRIGKRKVTGNVKVKLTSSLTLYLAFRIFDSIRHHVQKYVFRVRQEMLSKKVTKLLSVCKSNFLALIILLLKTVKLNAIKICILVDVV